MKARFPRARLAAALIVPAMLLAAWLLGRIGYRPLDWQIYTTAASQLASGESPYLGTLYFGPPWVALLLLPLSWLPSALSSGLWLLALLAGTLSLSALWIEQLRFPDGRGRRLAASAAAVISPAALYVYLTGQVTVLAGLALIYLSLPYAYRRRSALIAGAAVLLASAKPHVIAFPLLLLLLDDLRRRRWLRPLVTLVVLGAATAVSFAVRPAWPSEWLVALRGAAYLGGPESLSVGYIGLRELAVPGVLLALPLLYAAAYWFRRGATPTAVGLALASGLLWLPYTRLYDQILLWPAALTAAAEWRWSGARWMAAAPLLAFFVLPLTDLSLVLPAVLVVLLVARSSIRNPVEVALRSDSGP